MNLLTEFLPALVLLAVVWAIAWVIWRLTRVVIDPADLRRYREIAVNSSNRAELAEEALKKVGRIVESNPYANSNPQLAAIRDLHEQYDRIRREGEK